MNMVYLCNYNQIKKVPDDGDFIVMDAPDTLNRIVQMCIRHGLLDAHWHIPRYYLLNYLRPIDIRIGKPNV